MRLRTTSPTQPGLKRERCFATRTPRRDPRRLDPRPPRYGLAASDGLGARPRVPRRAARRHRRLGDTGSETMPERDLQRARESRRRFVSVIPRITGSRDSRRMVTASNGAGAPQRPQDDRPLGFSALSARYRITRLRGGERFAYAVVLGRAPEALVIEGCSSSGGMPSFADKLTK